MKKKPLLFIPLLLTSLKAGAFEMHLLKNDKELVSHAYSWMELKRAERQLGDSADQAFDLLGLTLQELESGKEICEIPLHRNFTRKLEENGIPSDQRNIRHLLTLWRSRQRIDDLFFEIMEQSAETGASIRWFEANKAQPWEIREMNELLTTHEISVDDIEQIYDGFKQKTLEHPGCSINRWSGVRDQISSFSRDSNAVRLMNIAAKEKGVLNELEFQLVEFYRLNGISDWNIQLSRYLQLIKEIKNRSIGTNPRGSVFEPNDLSSKKRDRKSRITYRQSLYYRFNGTQIRMIEELLKKTFDRMDATKAEVIFTYQNGSETIPVSPMGQYFLARKLLRKDMDDLNRSSFFGGNPVNHEDLVTAGLETGLLNREILDSVLKIDDLWNPEVKKWQKISNYAFRVTGTATIFLPPPYNVVSSMALVFLDGALMRNTRKASQADQDYDVF
jgi:hypothetical protein